MTRAPYSAFWYHVSYVIVKSWMRICYGLESRNIQNIPANSGALIVANHASFLDVPAIGCTLRRNACFVGRHTLINAPLLGWYFRRSGMLFIRRDSADHSVLRQMIDIAKSGEIVTLFPEGTRTPDGTLQKLRPGIVLAARRSGVPVIPAGISGTFDVFSRYRKAPRLFGKIVVSYGAPIELPLDDEHAALAMVRAALENEMRNAAKTKRDS